MLWAGRGGGVSNALCFQGGKIIEIANSFKELAVHQVLS